MERILLLVCLPFAACTSPRDADTSRRAPGRAEVGRQEAIHVVVDQKSRERVGFIETWKYDSGRILHWVYGLDRAERLGYLLENGRAYRFRWEVGATERKAEDLGVDTFAFGVRRILQHGAPVDCVETSEKSLGEELLESQKPKPAAAPPAKEAAGGGGGE
ncbi:MAG: hypothetical protein ACREID_07945 [Planctomycetota bacterium]